MRDTVLPVMVIGISGATWSVIDPMMADGALPNLRRLAEEGSWGALASVRTKNDRHYRPQTAWPSLLTGKLPERHGITRYFHTYRDMKASCVWEFFNEKGLSAGVYGTPVLWPPPRINGFVIPTPYGRDTQAWPAEESFIMEYYRHHQNSKLRTSYLRTLMKSLRFAPALLGRGRDSGLLMGMLRSALKLPGARDRETRALILRHAKLDFSTALFLSLYRKYRPHFAVFTSFELDYVSHRYWRYHEPERFADSSPDHARGLESAVRDAYAHMDACIGVILRRLPDKCVIVVASEHGMAAETRSNEIGRWQYLINGSRVKQVAGIGDDVAAVPIARWIVFRRNEGGALNGDVARLLEGIRVSESGRPLFTVHAHTDDEVIIKLNVQRGDYPDLDDIGLLHVEAGGGGASMPIDCILDRVGPRRSAMHARDGILLIKGPGIRSGHRIEGAVITDVMPTLLSAAGLSVPPDLDGRALDVFA